MRGKILCSLAVLFFSNVAGANGVPDIDEMRVRPGGEWQLPPMFYSNVYTTSLSVSKAFRSMGVATSFSLDTRCKELSSSERKGFEGKFWFGQGLGAAPPRCMLEKFDLKLDGVLQSIPRDAIEKFCEAPHDEPLRFGFEGKTFMVSFTGSSGSGTYEARLSFRDGHLVKRQVLAVDAAIERTVLFVDRYDEKGRVISSTKQTQ
jgi:hypothetical protein